MFTLGTKFRVINRPADVKIYDATLTTLRTTAAAVTATDVIQVPGYGTFSIASMTQMRMRRGVTASLQSKDWTVAAPAGLAVGESVEVRVTVGTERAEAEMAIDFVNNGRPFIFTTAALTGVTAADITTAIIAAWAAGAALGSARFPITVVAGASGTLLRTTALAGYEALVIKKVEIRRTAQGTASTSYLPLALATTLSPGGMGYSTGVLLSETVKLPTHSNNDVYGVDNSGVQVDLRALYTEVMFEISVTNNEIISHTVVNHSPLGQKISFTMYFNESTCNTSVNDIIGQLAAATIAVAAVAGTETTTTAIAAPLTTAQELTEALIIASGASVATAALFIA